MRCNFVVFFVEKKYMANVVSLVTVTARNAIGLCVVCCGGEGGGRQSGNEDSLSTTTTPLLTHTANSQDSYFFPSFSARCFCDIFFFLVFSYLGNFFGATNALNCATVKYFFYVGEVNDTNECWKSQVNNMSESSHCWESKSAIVIFLEWRIPFFFPRRKNPQIRSPFSSFLFLTMAVCPFLSSSSSFSSSSSLTDVSVSFLPPFPSSSSSLSPYPVSPSFYFSPLSSKKSWNLQVQYST